MASVLAGAALRGIAQDDVPRWVHPLCRSLPVDGDGPFAELADGSLITVDDGGIRVSSDDGKTWSETQKVCEGLDGITPFLPLSEPLFSPSCAPTWKSNSLAVGSGVNLRPGRD